MKADELHLEVGHTYQTQDGRKARIICVDRRTHTVQVAVGLFQLYDDLEAPMCYARDGTSPVAEIYDLVREVAP